MSHPFAALTPDLVLDAVESIGYLSDARVLALNSYENRVYQVGIEDETPLIAKFYRPDRWTDEAIREEHSFTFELAECEVPVVAPLVRDGETLFSYAGFRFALFPRRGGRAPEPGNLDQLYRLGQLSELMDGYQEFHDFNPRELPLIEGLRALRLMHYSAWLARRWDDPAFPMSFPWFGSERYWGDQILILREQLSALDEEPLKLF